MIRPQPASWFEIIAAADDVGEVLESLAEAGCAEIEPIAAGQPGGTMPNPEIFARITGWTCDAERLTACLADSRVRAVVHFPKPPEELQAPLILRNPGWIQPFEIFARLVGMPGRFSADPSGLLVFVAPILFGYMFGDVIQGLALIVIGLTLQWRWPMLRLLVAGGVAAMLFGFVFGANALGFVAVSQLTRWLVVRVGNERVMRWAVGTQAAAAVALLVVTAAGIGGLAAVLPPLFVIVSCIGAIFPTATALAMSPFPGSAGAAAAVIGTVQTGVGAVGGVVVSAIALQPAHAMGIVLVGSSAIAFCLVLLARSRRSRLSDSRPAADASG